MVDNVREKIMIVNSCYEGRWFESSKNGYVIERDIRIASVCGNYVGGCKLLRQKLVYDLF